MLWDILRLTVSIGRPLNMAQMHRIWLTSYVLVSLSAKATILVGLLTIQKAQQEK